MDEEKPGLGDNPNEHIFGPSREEVKRLNESPTAETPLQRLARSPLVKAVAAVLGVGATSSIPAEAHTTSQVEQQVTTAPTGDTISVAGQEFGLPTTEVTEVLPPTVEEPELLFAITPEVELFRFYSEAKLGQVVTEQSLSQLSNFKSKTTLASGNIEYRFGSALFARDHQVVTTADGQVIFKRVVTTIPETWEHPEVADYLKKYGDPEQTLTGHAYYGQHEQVRLYYKNGLAIISHPAGEVSELLVYQPMTEEAFQKSWGSELGRLPGP